eukprot:3713655-Pyramimonas_sp.AAC.1
MFQGSQESPKRAPREPQEGHKRAPRGSQEGRKRHTRGSEEAPERPSKAQDDLKDGSNSPSWLKMAPKICLLYTSDAADDTPC